AEDLSHIGTFAAASPAPIHRSGRARADGVLSGTAPASGPEDADAWDQIYLGGGRSQRLRLGLTLYTLLSRPFRPPSARGTLPLSAPWRYRSGGWRKRSTSARSAP